MFFAPPLPPGSNRPGTLLRILFSLLVAALLLVLLPLNALLYTTSHFLQSGSPKGLYHQAWYATNECIFEPAQAQNWKQWEHKYDNQINTDEDAAKYINLMLASLNDRYTYFLDAKQLKDEHDREQGHFTGIGTTLSVKMDAKKQMIKDADGKPIPESTSDGYPLIKSVVAGGPAKAAGIVGGDAILSVNGQDTRNLNLDKLVEQIRGKEGTPVTLGIRHANGKVVTVPIVRRQIVIKPVSTKHLSNGIGYLRLEDFEQTNATDEMKAGLKDLDDCKALIIDVRGNPGGFVNNAIDIASLLLDQGTVVSITARVPGDGYETSTYKLTKDALLRETASGKQGATSKTIMKLSLTRQQNVSGKRPIIVLINGNSASAAEMFTGAVKDNGRVTVLGTRSFGKGIGQSMLPMPNATELHVTSLRYYTPDGSWLGDGGNSVSSGIQPNIVVEPTPDLEFGAGNDNQLQKAVDILTKQLGGSTSIPDFRTTLSTSC